MRLFNVLEELVSLLNEGAPVEIMIGLLQESIQVPEKPALRDDEQWIIPRANHDRVVLVSGGLDSFIALLGLGFGDGIKSDTYCLYLDFGQPYSGAELAALKDLEVDVNYEPTNIEYDPETSAWKHIIPGRNMVAIMKAAEYVKPNGDIWLSAVNGETPPTGGDKSATFFSLVESFLIELGRPAKIRTHWAFTKGELVKRWITTDHAPLLLKTYSCFEGEIGWHCGKCQACLRRWAALRWGGFTDLEVLHNYREHPVRGAPEAVRKYTYLLAAELVKPGITSYGQRRAEQDLAVIAPDVYTAVTGKRFVFPGRK